MNSCADYIFNTSISKLFACPNHEVIEQIELTNHVTGEISYLPIDEVIINHGYEQDTSLLGNSDLNNELADNFYMQESSVPGLYVAGDILSTKVN